MFFSVLGLFFAAYGLITQNFRFSPYMLLWNGCISWNNNNKYFISGIGTPLKYTVIGMGIMSFIAILIEMIITKKKQTTS